MDNPSNLKQGNSPPNPHLTHDVDEDLLEDTLPVIEAIDATLFNAETFLSPEEIRHEIETKADQAGVSIETVAEHYRFFLRHSHKDIPDSEGQIKHRKTILNTLNKLINTK